MQLYRFLEFFPARVHTHAAGAVEFAAMTVFLAGRERSAEPETRFLIHSVKPIAHEPETETGRIARQQGIDHVNDLLTEIYRARTRLSDVIMTRFRTEDVVLDSREALEFGIIDKIESRPDLTGLKAAHPRQ